MSPELSDDYYTQLPLLSAKCFKKALQYEQDGRRCMETFDTHGAFALFSLSRSYMNEAAELERRFNDWLKVTQ